MGKGSGESCRQVLVLETQPQGFEVNRGLLKAIAEASNWQGALVAKLEPLFPSGQAEAYLDAMVRARLLTKTRRFKLTPGEKAQTLTVYKLSLSGEKLLSEFEYQDLSQEAKEVMMGFLAKEHQESGSPHSLEMTLGELREIAILKTPQIKAGLQELKGKGILYPGYKRRNLMKPAALKTLQVANRTLKLPWDQELASLKLVPGPVIGFPEPLSYKKNAPTIEELSDEQLDTFTHSDSISPSYIAWKSQEARMSMDRMCDEGYLSANKSLTAEIDSQGELSFKGLTQGYYRLTEQGAFKISELCFNRLSKDCQESFKSLASGGGGSFNLTAAIKLGGQNRQATRVLLEELISKGFLAWDRGSRPRYRYTTLGSLCLKAKPWAIQ